MSPSPARIVKRKLSNQGLDDWGNFVDCDERHESWDDHDDISPRPPERRALSLPNPVTAPPMYVLESSLETQQLWYATAGQRPRQPDHERRYFEKLWMKNFEASAVPYAPNFLSPEASATSSSGKAQATAVDTRPSTSTLSTTNSTSAVKKLSGMQGSTTSFTNSNQSLVTAAFNRATATATSTVHFSSSSSYAPTTTGPNGATAAVAAPVDKIPPHEFNCTVLFRGRGPFSKSVSKSFVTNDMTMVTLQLPRYRVVEDKAGHVYAEYLIVVSLGSTGSITLGIWKRHSDFLALADQV